MNQTQRFFLSGRESLALLGAVAIVAVASVAAVLFVNNRAEAILSARQAAIVDSEIRYLQVIDAQEGREALVRAVARRAAVSNDDLPLHALIDNAARYLAGDVDWPAGLVADGTWRPIETNKRDTGGKIEGFGRAVVLPDGAKVLVGRDRTAQSALRSALLQAIMLALVVLLAVAASLVLLLNRRVLAHIDAIVATARRIIAGNLHERIPTGGERDEFDRLGQVLNEMLARNETHIEQMRVVTDAIAHDLRMPLQRVKADLERIQTVEDAALREQALMRADGEIDAALVTFNALIEITRAEAGVGAEIFELVDLARVVNDVVEMFEPVAEDKGQTLQRAVEPATIRGQSALLRQAVGNLIQNAIKFSPAGTSIAVRLQQSDRAAVLIVEDAGPGIPEADIPVALRPFGRLARDSAQDGKGLGLALVAAYAKLHGAVLRLENASPGLRAIMEFPKA